MRVAALISGGKDSCYNMMQCIAAGHQIVALANLRPAENQVGSDELDSYMYQTVGHHAIDLYAEAMALPLYRRTIRGRSVDTGRVYTKCEGDEVEDLYELLKLVKEKEEVEGISVGAILSDYQRVRVENVCKRLNLQPLAYLWQRNQEDLLREMISSNIQAIIIKVAALGIHQRWSHIQLMHLHLLLIYAFWNCTWRTRRDKGRRKMNDDLPTFEFSTAFLPHPLPHLCPQAEEQKNDLVRRNKAFHKL
ncbi:diphthine--ammonia ligase isoform X4 [Ursus maritimus]|uniref:Diphthine--ammonia ligase n=1 Tax=Ursus maritimus TaxID=29073 RepID=A0A8M1EZ24_URSMA|nr:diphthine--ammonia ligase isoform X4 [Ursus maritimus]